VHSLNIFLTYTLVRLSIIQTYLRFEDKYVNKEGTLNFKYIDILHSVVIHLSQLLTSPQVRKRNIYLSSIRG